MSAEFPIAVVGLAAELPSGTTSTTNLDVNEFYEFLLNKSESYEKMPADRFNIDKLKGRGLGQITTDIGSFLKDIKVFDHLEFGVTKKDALCMPIAVRKLIETTFRALLDSGIEYRGKNVGCFMAGVSHEPVQIGGHDDMQLTGSFAGGFANMANRVSYHLDLRGPSIPSDTACSSSLVVTHLAVQALRNGECEAAVVGGAQLNHRFTEWPLYCQGGILAPDGKCKPFDAGADGFSRAEGVVSMVLKPLDAAIRDNDKIYATILGTGLNNSGSLAPVNAPVASAQRDAMERAFTMAHRRPQDVDFIELHATGTATGDPTEANWVGESFKRDDELLIGSVKGNVGHLEISSFLTSLCKVVGIIKTGLVAPNVNLSKLNPAIHWDEYKFRVPLEAEPLPCRSPSGISLFAVAGSGISGTNGHAVIESPPKVAHPTNSFWVPGTTIPGLLVAGGLSPRSASSVVEVLQDMVNEYSSHTLSRVYGRRSRSLTWRAFAIESEGKLSRFSTPVLAPKATPPVIFVLSGQGPQHLRMGYGLYKTSAVFRSSILELDAVHKRATGYSLIERYGLFAGSESAQAMADIWPIAVTLPALTMLQLAMIDTLASVGIKPDVVIGHSAGETALLYASGAGPKEIALELSIARGKAMALLEEKKGTMAAVSCSPEEADKIIAEVVKELGPGSLEIGCYNTPGSITLSGAVSHIDLAVAKATDLGIFARALRTRVPVHSSMMELCEKEYRSLAGAVFDKYKHSHTLMPKVVTYSTVTGKLLESPFNADYFWDGTRNPVCFTQGMQALTASYSGATYVEIGPHPVLSGYISALSGKDCVVACPLKRAKDGDQSIEVTGFLETVGKMAVAGHSIDFDVLYGGLGDSREPPAKFPFANREVPYHAQSLIVTKQKQHRNGPLNYPQLQINAKTHPGLADHLIKDEPIMPATGYVEMALEFGARKLWNTRFISILGLSSEDPVPIQAELKGMRWTIRSAAPGDQYVKWPISYDRAHATGFLSTDATVEDKAPLDIARIRSRVAPANMKTFYQRLAEFAQYGPLYQRITECFRGTNEQGQQELLVRVRANDADLQPEIEDYHIHPAIFDAAVHAAVHPMITGCRDGQSYYLPARAGYLETHDALYAKPFPKFVYSHLTLVRTTPDTLTYDGIITDESGNRLITMKDLDVALHGNFTKKITKRYEVQHKETEIVVSRAATTAKATKGPAPLIFEYVRGEEMAWQKELAALDTLTHYSLWFHSASGKNGDASVGFARSLKDEFPSWTVGSVVFDPSWTAEERKSAVYQLLDHPDREREMYVDAAGKVSVTRIMEAEPPSSTVPFEASAPWVQERSKIVQVSEPDVPADHVLVKVSASTVPQADIWSFVGHVKGSSKRVIGVTTGALTNIVIAPKGSVVEIAEDETNVPDALAHAIVGLAVGGFISNTERLQHTTVAVEEAGAELTSQITQLLTKLGVNVVTFTMPPSIVELQKLAMAKPGIVIATTQSKVDAHNVTDMIHTGSRIISWQDDAGIARLLLRDPYAVGDAIRSAISKVPVAGSYKTPVEATGIEVPSQVESRAKLFSAEKAYVLVGGIGSLGVEIAHWMYKNGARYIVLTSRSGRDSVYVKGNFLSKRLLAYLESLPDLTLRLVAANAYSLNDMAGLFADIMWPVGGVITLSVVLSDRLFTSHTAETFETPFPSKIASLEVLEQIISFDRLDFLVCLSSVSAMFGNAGQTNYAAANTLMSGMIKKYRKAMTLVVPAINDSSIALTEDDYFDSRIKHLTVWGITSGELCQYLGDAICKLKDAPVWEYIPYLSWNAVCASLGNSPMYAHYVTDEGKTEGLLGEATGASIKEIVCNILNVAPEDLSADVPFTTYGLDSLSAASLAHALTHLVRISQIQLLADVTLRKLEDLREAREAESAENATA
jgi:acyl transferase domain-containing protein/aryl carrier-like protein